MSNIFENAVKAIPKGLGLLADKLGFDGGMKSGSGEQIANQLFRKKSGKNADGTEVTADIQAAEAAAAAGKGMKRGGSVKSSASRRGDGIAQRGKTRGKLC